MNERKPLVRPCRRLILLTHAEQHGIFKQLPCEQQLLRRCGGLLEHWRERRERGDGHLGCVGCGGVGQISSRTRPSRGCSHRCPLHAPHVACHVYGAKGGGGGVCDGAGGVCPASVAGSGGVLQGAWAEARPRLDPLARSSQRGILFDQAGPRSCAGCYGWRAGVAGNGAKTGARRRGGGAGLEPWAPSVRSSQRGICKIGWI